MTFQIHRPTAHTLFSQTVLAPGWKIKFYLTGTSTPVDVWTTSARNVAHDWPVEADAAGVLPVIYLDPTVVYKTEVYDQNDVLQPEYGADPANEQLLSQSIIGALLNPTTAAETSASVTPTDKSIPSHEKVGVVLAQRYGWDAAATGADNYAALVKAKAVASQCSCPLELPGGTFNYEPSARMDIDVTFRGAGQIKTLILVDDAYAGVVFREVDYGHVCDMTIKQDTLAQTAGSIGLQLAAADTGDFVGHLRVTNVLLQGFQKDLDIQNVFLVTLDRVRFQDGEYGTFCEPDASNGNGFVTTIKHINCYWHGNERNVHYNPSVNSYDISFDGGGWESSTGSLAQAYFNKVFTLKIENFYSEGNDTQPWIEVAEVANTSIDGMITIAAGEAKFTDYDGFVNIKNAVLGGTSVLNILGTQHYVSIENTTGPTSGHTIAGRQVQITDSYLNGIRYTNFSQGSAANAVQSVSSNGPFRSRHERVVITTAGAQDVFRFLDELTGTAQAQYIVGDIYIRAIDTSSGANFANYKGTIGSAANGTGSAALTQTRLNTGGTDPGTSSTPFSLAADGGGGAVKLQFTKNAGVSSVTLDVQFVGLATP